MWSIFVVHYQAALSCLALTEQEERGVQEHSQLKDLWLLEWFVAYVDSCIYTNRLDYFDNFICASFISVEY